MAMSKSKGSCKLCDQRLIYSTTREMRKKVLDYSGDKILGRKYPSLSCPENCVEFEVVNQRLFIFSGIDVMYNFMLDGGYFMYSLSSNSMRKLEIHGEDNQRLLQKCQSSVNTIKHP